MKLTYFFTILFAVSSTYLHAYVEQIPGPDDQGGMVMPIVSIQGNNLSLSWMGGMGGSMEWDPSTDSVLMGSIGYWTDGDSFEPGTAYGDLLNPVSEGGQGNLFSSRYGFWVDGTSLESGDYLVLRLASMPAGLVGWNSLDSELESVFTQAGDYVLWNGDMWHTLFTISPDAAPGLYAATFEVLVGTATEPVTWAGAVGSASYTQNTDYNTLSITYNWKVVPEPSALALAGLAILGGVVALRFRKVREVNAS